MVLARQPEKFTRARIDLGQKRRIRKICGSERARSVADQVQPEVQPEIRRGQVANAPLSPTVAFSSSAHARTQAVWQDSWSGLNFSLIPVHLTLVLPVGNDWKASTSISAPSKIIWGRKGGGWEVSLEQTSGQAGVRFGCVGRWLRAPASPQRPRA